MKKRVIKPLRETSQESSIDKRLRKLREKRARELANAHPREAWVREAVEGYVLRRFVPRKERHLYVSHLTESGWWESSLCSHSHAVLAAQKAGRDVMIYAYRVAADGERHIALIPRHELLGE